MKPEFLFFTKGFLAGFTAGVILFMRYDLCLRHPWGRANYRQAGTGGRLLGFTISHTKGAV